MDWAPQTLVRFQSAVANRLGRFPGVFAMANGLAHQGLLSPEDHQWWRSANDAANAAYHDPSTVDPSCYDPTLNPGARSWFKSDATGLLSTVQQYLALLDRYAVPWHELRTRTPGRIVYEDDVQVVAVPHTHAEHWPFDTTRTAAAGEASQPLEASVAVDTQRPGRRGSGCRRSVQRRAR
ncbi:hypothetical protein [Desertihabitans aurantiacus]|uniref:hypothetical protein n=1 Tax=Desertihabitans aurantiacus TaxID=2282477 RepID=UPI0013006CFD|nr:hypothetical protein [Desertihabitans aurantiacus]